MSSDFGEAKKSASCSLENSSNQDAVDFDCNICFDLVRDPVVTLCGHLFCWQCLYRWLHYRSRSRGCPICKAVVEEENLVPLYGKGRLVTDPRMKSYLGMKIPLRPSGQRPPTVDDDDDDDDDDDSDDDDSDDDDDDADDDEEEELVEGEEFVEEEEQELVEEEEEEGEEEIVEEEELGDPDYVAPPPPPEIHTMMHTLLLSLESTQQCLREFRGALEPRLEQIEQCIKECHRDAEQRIKECRADAEQQIKECHAAADLAEQRIKEYCGKYLAEAEQRAGAE